MLQIKNMKSDRCKIFVKNELNKLGLQYKTIKLGEVKLKENISNEKWQLFNIALKNIGLELLVDKKNKIIESVKDAIKELICNDSRKINYSNYISNKVKMDYSTISSLFSSTQGITIQKYIIEKKIEHVKELLVYSKNSFDEIAISLQYSSVAHLSYQFKKITGLTLTFFRNNRKT